MELIKLIDTWGDIHYLNINHIISIRPFKSICEDNQANSSIEYGSSWMNSIYMKEPVHEVASMIQGVYIR